MWEDEMDDDARRWSVYVGVEGGDECWGVSVDERGRRGMVVGPLWSGGGGAVVAIREGKNSCNIGYGVWRMVSVSVLERKRKIATLNE